MKELTIGEVAQQVGMNVSAIRYYEEIGLLPKSKRKSGQRRFEPEIVQWLTLIQFAQKAGFTLDEVKTLFHGFEPNTTPAERWQALAQQKRSEIRLLIERAHKMEAMLETVLQCGCMRLEECVSIAGDVCTPQQLYNP